MRSLRRLLVRLLFLLPLAACAGAEETMDNRNDEMKITLPQPKAGRAKPLAVVLAANSGAETTDFLVPYGVLKESGVFDVLAVSTQPGTVSLHPALKIRADRTTGQFDALHPEGADIVIVPAMHEPDNPDVLRWLKKQAASGATIVGVCDGVWTLAHLGLLEGRRATGHWYSLAKLERQFPATNWTRGLRYVADGSVVTTTGVTASLPVSLALVEAVAGRAAASATAQRLGARLVGPRHDNEAFRLSAPALWTLAVNWLGLWRHERIALPVKDGDDEIALAFAADAWSRTYRSRLRATSADERTVRSARGLVLEVEPAQDADHVLRLPADTPVGAWDRSLEEIEARYGRPTADFVALQLEYPR